MKEQFFGSGGFVNSYHFLDEEGDVDMVALRNEGERRLTSEYIKDTAEAFMPFIEMIDHKLKERKLTWDNITKLIGLPTGSDRIARIMKGFLDANEVEFDIGDMIIGRYEGTFSTETKFDENDIVLLVDDSIYRGTTVNMAMDYLLENNVLEENVLIAIGVEDKSGDLSNLRYEVSVMSGDDAYRWSQRDMDKMPEFNIASRMKVGNKLRDNNLYGQVTQQFMESDYLIGQEVAKIFRNMEADL